MHSIAYFGNFMWIWYLHSRSKKQLQLGWRFEEVFFCVWIRQLHRMRTVLATIYDEAQVLRQIIEWDYISWEWFIHRWSRGRIISLLWGSVNPKYPRVSCFLTRHSPIFLAYNSRNKLGFSNMAFYWVFIFIKQCWADTQHCYRGNKASRQFKLE